jgi:hypothetical protein
LPKSKHICKLPEQELRNTQEEADVTVQDSDGSLRPEDSTTNCWTFRHNSNSNGKLSPVQLDQEFAENEEG